MLRTFSAARKGRLAALFRRAPLMAVGGEVAALGGAFFGARVGVLGGELSGSEAGTLYNDRMEVDEGKIDKRLQPRCSRGLPLLWQAIQTLASA